MKTQIDHLVVMAPSLDLGVQWCEATLGITPSRHIGISSDDNNFVGFSLLFCSVVFNFHGTTSCFHRLTVVKQVPSKVMGLTL
jgi:hypothetical protein